MANVDKVGLAGSELKVGQYSDSSDEWGLSLSLSLCLTWAAKSMLSISGMPDGHKSGYDDWLT